jgi:hypothetical protein
MEGFVREHSLFCGPASGPFLSAEQFPSGPVRVGSGLTTGGDFVQEQSPGEEPILSLMARGLAFDPHPGWMMNQHHARGGLVDILTPMPSGTHEGFLDVLGADAQRGQSLNQFCVLLGIDLHGFSVR